jgi:hybrid cluster-associated redox disulfide protein
MQALFDAPQPTDRKDTDAAIAALFAPAQRTVTASAQTGIMKKIALPTAELTVDSVMQRWPSTIRIFLDFGLNCVGCPIATFHSVDEACSEHGIDLEKFLERLRETAAQTSAPAETGRDWPSASPNRA